PLRRAVPRQGSAAPRGGTTRFPGANEPTRKTKPDYRKAGAGRLPVRLPRPQSKGGAQFRACRSCPKIRHAHPGRRISQKRRTSMRRILSAFLALAVSATLFVVATSWKHGATAVHAQGGCSNATLTGNYPFIYSGANAPGHSVRGKNTFGNAAVGVF